MAYEFRLSKCGRDFDEYVARVFGPWDPGGSESRTLGDLWHGRRLKIHQGGEWREGRVLSWTQSVEDANRHSKWRLELELVNNVTEQGRNGMILLDDEEKYAVTTFPVNRLNIDGGGTLKSDSEASSAELVSLEWMQPAEPVLDLNKGVLSYTCPYCRAIEPVVAAHEDPMERSQECPVCLETCECRVLQCGHGICHACWDSCRRSAILSLVDVDKLEAEEIANERTERDRLFGMLEIGDDTWKERVATFTGIARETPSGKNGLTRFYRELMVENPIIWMEGSLYDLYEKMPVARQKILLQALEDRKVEWFGLGERGATGERVFHSMSARTADWIFASYIKAGWFRHALPWLKIATHHGKWGFVSGGLEGHLRALGILHLKYDQLTPALHSFDECLSLGPDNERAYHTREKVVLEMKEWTGASGKLTPGC